MTEFGQIPHVQAMIENSKQCHVSSYSSQTKLSKVLVFLQVDGVSQQASMLKVSVVLQVEWVK